MHRTVSISPASRELLELLGVEHALAFHAVPPRSEDERGAAAVVARRARSDRRSVPSCASARGRASIAASSSGVPITFGPVNHLRAETSHHRPVMTNTPPTITGVKLNTSMNLIPSPQLNCGSIRMMQMSTTQITAIQPTSALHLPELSTARLGTSSPARRRRKIGMT